MFIYSCHNSSRENFIVVIGIFVDDLLVIGNSADEIAITMIKERMSQKNLLSDQGELDYYMDVEVTKLDENTMLLHQTAYANKVLE